MNDDKKIPESFKVYEDGKHRRYTLMFAVNGGAFALAQWIADKGPSAAFGGLKLSSICYGMALFTLAMSMDIYMFGQKMRRHYLPDAFGWQGKIVLFLIGTLICAAWILAAKTT